MIVSCCILALLLATQARFLITGRRNWIMAAILILGSGGSWHPIYGEIITTPDNPASHPLDPIIPPDELNIQAEYPPGSSRSGSSREAELLYTTDIIPINRNAYARPLYINILWVVDQSYGTAPAASKLIRYIIDELASSPHNIKLKMGLISTQPLPDQTTLNTEYTSRFGAAHKLIFTKDPNIFKYVTLEGAIQHLAIDGFSQMFRHSVQDKQKLQKNIIVFITKEDSKHYPPPRRGGFLSNLWKVVGVVAATLLTAGWGLPILSTFASAVGTGALIDHAVTTSERERRRKDYYTEISRNKYQRRLTAALSLEVLEKLFGDYNSFANLEIWSIVGGARTETYTGGEGRSAWQIKNHILSHSGPLKAYYPQFQITAWNAKNRRYNSRYRELKDRMDLNEGISVQDIHRESCDPPADSALLCEIDYAGIKNSAEMMSQIRQTNRALHTYFRDDAQSDTFSHRRLKVQHNLQQDLPAMNIIEPTYNEERSPQLTRLTLTTPASPPALKDYRDFVASASLADLSPEGICKLSPARFVTALQGKEINPRPQCIRIKLHSRAQDAGCKQRTGYEYLKLARRTGGLSMTPCEVEEHIQKQDNVFRGHLTAPAQLLAYTSPTITLTRRAHKITKLHFTHKSSRETDSVLTADSPVIRLWNAELARLRANPESQSMLVSHRGSRTYLHLYFDKKSFEAQQPDPQLSWADFQEFSASYQQHPDEPTRTLQISYAIASP